MTSKYSSEDAASMWFFELQPQKILAESRWTSEYFKFDIPFILDLPILTIMKICPIYVNVCNVIKIDKDSR